MGAHWTGAGVNFAVFSASATAIHLCVFDPSGSKEIARHRLPERSDDVFHGFVAGLEPGAIYGLRAEGPWAPADGHFFNPNKLQLDPYAREVIGSFDWSDVHRPGTAQAPDTLDERDNAASALKGRVVDDRFDWGGEQAPRRTLAETVLYEMHVKGFSKLNPNVPEALRGTYAGLGHAASIDHLKRLGVSAVSLLPVHQRVDEERLVEMGLVNYWGYNTINFFCPDPRLAAAPPGQGVRDEFRKMVKSLHAAGIEVILDVVYNHTAEADGAGPSISFRGLDNASYYRLDPANRRNFENPSGTGNAVDIRQPHVLRLVMDSLRYWVSEMHVDGFRFDLASVLGRGDAGFDPHSAFFTAVAQDPVLAQVKMIAEPWDIGPGGYQVGGFPRGWAEWNDKFRDDMRGYWLQGAHNRGALAHRLCGSADLFQHSGRAPAASINYVISHDGFTLRDLVSYNDKHNEANGEDNRDGTSNNLSNNCGVEGPTDDPQINALRAHMQRVLLATTLLAQGTPMICGGDELGHSQNGNNNPYCQDNETTWIDWSRADDALIAFAARVIALRTALLPFANHWYDGSTPADGLVWTGGDGETLHDDAWNDEGHRAIGCLINAPGRGEEPVVLMMNGSEVDVDFVLPAGHWKALLDTADPRGEPSWTADGEAPFPLKANTLAVLVGSGASAAP